MPPRGKKPHPTEKQRRPGSPHSKKRDLFPAEHPFNSDPIHAEVPSLSILGTHLWIRPRNAGYEEKARRRGASLRLQIERRPRRPIHIERHRRVLVDNPPPVALPLQTQRLPHPEV